MSARLGLFFLVLGLVVYGGYIVYVLIIGDDSSLFFKAVSYTHLTLPTKA